jgi:hypothetical protein
VLAKTGEGGPTSSNVGGATADVARPPASVSDAGQRSTRGHGPREPPAHGVNQLHRYFGWGLERVCRHGDGSRADETEVEAGRRVSQAE